MAPHAALDPGPYLLGERFSGCDIFVYMLTTWRPDEAGMLARCENVASCAALVIGRPAVQRIQKTNGRA